MLLSNQIGKGQGRYILVTVGLDKERYYLALSRIEIIGLTTKVQAIIGLYKDRLETGKAGLLVLDKSCQEVAREFKSLLKI